MSDLVNRLRQYGRPEGRGSAHPQNVACQEAAARIEELERERDVWREKHAHMTKCERQERERADRLAALLKEAVEALSEIAGVGFDAPMTWSRTDEEWKRHRANIMQGAARATLARIAEKGDTDE